MGKGITGRAYIVHSIAYVFFGNYYVSGTVLSAGDTAKRTKSLPS